METSTGRDWFEVVEDAFYAGDIDERRQVLTALLEKGYKDEAMDLYADTWTHEGMVELALELGIIKDPYETN